MRISGVRVKKTQSFEDALKQGFAVNYFECADDEIVLMLPTSAEALTDAVKHFGWEAVGEVVTSH